MEILPASMFVPVALGFFGLATGYLIYGPQELFGYPPRDRQVDRSNGVWGILMPGFCQFLVGLYLFVGLTWFEVFTTNKTLYMAALAFSAYGIHWFALGWIRLQGSDARPNGYMSIPFVLLGILGMIVFFKAGDWPLGLLFTGLMLVYVAEFFASFNIGGKPALDGRPASNPGQKVLGLLHIVVGLWLVYLTFAATLNLASGSDLPA
ncbi:hypothetical protein [Catellatospora coxensis]|uniref:Uncharacterized protein n=1 Tax=Catellatospora coxensis TaxID=310354 RepID=A0A8J3KN11_9ACTN|nr:hypothetical protein [Catellatospora coxensis]GIG05982.1 hypothetical protein Cco03nite_26820 [Catellatospora coxensis]